MTGALVACVVELIHFVNNPAQLQVRSTV